MKFITLTNTTDRAVTLNPANIVTLERAIYGTEIQTTNRVIQVAVKESPEQILALIEGSEPKFSNEPVLVDTVTGKKTTLAAAEKAVRDALEQLRQFK